MTQLLVVGLLMQVAYLTFYLVGGTKTLLFIVVNAVNFLFLSALIVRLRKVSVCEQPSLLWLIVGFAVLFRLTLVPLEPVGSGDIYRYLWDGKVSVSGVNPYAYAPSDPLLRGLHTTDLPAKVSFPDMRTIYPPLAQMLFAGSFFLFGDSVSGFKLLIVLADLGVVFVLLLILKRMSLNPALLILYAWSPAVVMYGALDGHLEPFAILFLMLFIHAALSSRHWSASLALGLGGLAKFYPLFVVPLLMRFVRGWTRLWLPLVTLAIMAAGGILYYERGGGLFESLGVYNTSFEFNGSLFTLLLHVLDSNLQAHIVCGVLFASWLIVIFLIDRPLIEKVFLTFLGFIILSPVVHPWYLLWLASLLVLRWSLAVFVLIGLSNLSNIVVYRYHVTGSWRDDPVLIVMEYVPFFVLLGWEVWGRGRFAAPGVMATATRQIDS